MNLKQVVSKHASKEQMNKKASKEVVKAMLDKYVLSIDPDLLAKVSGLETQNKYELNFNIGEGSYITYALELVNNGINQFTVEGEVLDAKIFGFVEYYNEQIDSNEEIEVEIPVDLNDVRVDVYMDNDNTELSSVEVKDNGGLQVTFVGTK